MLKDPLSSAITSQNSVYRTTDYSLGEPVENASFRDVRWKGRMLSTILVDKYGLSNEIVRPLTGQTVNCATTRHARGR
jgi:hypothetical protein